MPMIPREASRAALCLNIVACPPCSALAKFIHLLPAWCPSLVVHIPAPEKTHVLGSAKSNTGDAGDLLEVQLLNGLAGLLLIAAVDLDRRAGGAITGLELGVGAVIVVDLGLGDGLLVREFLDSGVGHIV